MHFAEIPLLIFTILGQLSVGVFLVLGAIDLIGSAKWGAKRVELVSDPALYAIGPTLALGFAGSFLHLGNPLNAMNAMNHLGSSWMSREILVGVLFGAAGAVYAIAQLFHLLTPLLRQILAVLTAIIGVVLVFVMAQLYQLPTVPVWNHWTTTAQFFGTTVLLGAMAVAVALAWPLTKPVRHLARDRRSAEARAAYSRDLDAARHEMVLPILRWLAVVAIVALGFIMIVNLAWIGHLVADGSVSAQQSLGVITERGGIWLIAHLGLALLGTGIMGFFLFRLVRAEHGMPKGLVWVLALAFTLVFVGEIIGRLLFYSAYVRTGF